MRLVLVRERNSTTLPAPPLLTLRNMRAWKHMEDCAPLVALLKLFQLFLDAVAAKESQGVFCPPGPSAAFALTTHRNRVPVRVGPPDVVVVAPSQNSGLYCLGIERPCSCAPRSSSVYGPPSVPMARRPRSAMSAVMPTSLHSSTSPPKAESLRVLSTKEEKGVL